MQDFRGRTAVITGGASGIGFALATAFAAEGARAVIADIEGPALKAAEQALRDAGAEVLAAEVDVSDAGQMDELASRVLAEWGPVHVLCNNAGVGLPGSQLWNTPLEDWHWLMGTNLWGVIHGIRSFVPGMVEHGDDGHIVNIASIAGLLAPPGQGAYNASKYAVVAMSENLRAELAGAQARIGVSVVCPAWVRTGILEPQRNRPGADFTPNPDIDKVWESIPNVIEPAQVAGNVVRGIRENQFWIIPHAESVPWLRERANDMLASQIAKRTVTIWSEGTRVAADVYTPAAEGPHPAIVLCHGWGGLKSHLTATYAPFFARAGFKTITFDYRGWGESDGKLIADGALPLTEPTDVEVRARVVREVVDPFDQLLDIQAAIDFLWGEGDVDRDRIGIWGTSYGAGHAVYTAATDSRIACVVAQVGSYGIGDDPAIIAECRARAAQKARGELDVPIPQGIDVAEGLNGTPDYAKMGRYNPKAFVSQVRVPTLVIDAEREELMDIREHGAVVYEQVKQNAPARYEVFPCTHYEIYDRYYRQASSLARDWFLEYLQSS